MSLKIPKSIVTQLPKTTEVAYEINNETKIYIHFYNPIGDGDWYVMAGDRTGNDWTFLGVILFDDARFGCFTLSELKKKKLPFGFKIQLDKKFKPQTWQEVRASKTS